MDRINNINETGGAGDEGTDELVQKLQQDTPGQPTKRKPKMKKFRDILEGVDPIQENVNKESKLLAKEINDAARRETGGDKKDFQTVAKLIGSGKLKDAAKHMSKLDTVVLEDLVTFIMGHESVFKAMYPKARPGQAVALFAREETEQVNERVHYAFDTQDAARQFEKKVAGMPMNIVRVGSGKYYVVELRPGANKGVQEKAAKIAVSIGLSEGYRKATAAEIAADKKKDGKKDGDRHSRIKGKVYGNAMGKEEVEEAKNCGCGQDPCITYGKVDEAMSPADKAKRLKMIKQAVEKLNKSNLERAKKDALKMMKDSGMFDEELEEAKGAPKIKGLNIYGSEINGLRKGTTYYSAKPVDMRGKLMFKVVDEFGSIETIDLKTFAKRFG